MSDEPQKAQDPAEEELPLYNEAGVDLTLVRWMLSLTPAERLEELQQHVAATLRVMSAGQG